MSVDIQLALKRWFKEAGAYVLVDGQFGSTGKGLIAGAIAEALHDRIDICVSNAGPNSGHTSYFKDRKIVLKQLPTAAVISHLLGDSTPVFLSAGAVIDPYILGVEIAKYAMPPVMIDPRAAVITPEDKEKDKNTVKRIASTGQGVGPAICRKIERLSEAVWGINQASYNTREPITREQLLRRRAFFEIPQGFSLGINSGFYPHVTSRECSVSQALSDAGMPPSFHKKTIMTVRTYPIRVGNTENSSGPCYPDQNELNWNLINREPEFTTVTNRMRRVFTWSPTQYLESLYTLAPDVIAVTFCDYLVNYPPYWIRDYIVNPYKDVFGRWPEAVLYSTGPRTEDIRVY